MPSMANFEEKKIIEFLLYYVLTYFTLVLAGEFFYGSKK